MRLLKKVQEYFLRESWAPGTSSGLPHDGLGQNLLIEMQWIYRYGAMRKRNIVWRRATIEEQKRHETHNILGRFGDMTYAVASDGAYDLVVRERLWHGFPDPPQYAIFAFLPNGSIWLACDFDWWPRLWTFVEQSGN